MRKSTQTGIATTTVASFGLLMLFASFRALLTMLDLFYIMLKAPEEIFTSKVVLIVQIGFLMGIAGIILALHYGTSTINTAFEMYMSYKKLKAEGK